MPDLAAYRTASFQRDQRFIMKGGELTTPRLAGSVEEKGGFKGYVVSKLPSPLENKLSADEKKLKAENKEAWHAFTLALTEAAPSYSAAFDALVNTGMDGHTSQPLTGRRIEAVLNEFERIRHDDRYK